MVVEMVKVNVNLKEPVALYLDNWEIHRTLKDLHNVKSDCAILCFEAIPVMFKDTVFACCTALRQNTEADDQKQTQFCVSYVPLKKRNWPRVYYICI